MAGEVLSAFLQVLFQTAFNLLQEELKLEHELEGKRKELHNNVSMIKAVINKAEEKAHGDEPLKLWLENLRKVGYDAVDVLDELSYEAQRRQLISLSESKHLLNSGWGLHIWEDAAIDVLILPAGW